MTKYKLVTLTMLISLMLGGYTASAALPTPNETFNKPNNRYTSDLVVVTQPMTKSEFATILSSLEKYSSSVTENSLDVTDTNFSQIIIFQNKIKGTAKEHDRLNDSLTREQAAKMIYDMLGLEQYNYAAEKNFTDSNHISFNQEVYTLCALGILDGYSDSSFRPNQILSRIESANIIDRLFSKGILLKL
ncbi:Mannan endo-1,4-beta-mannosidase [Paenibacillus nuruki]|uniref:Mannan endo-1,4-beta-mannosidase n=1 Tax=Paenibacillus nuruki TaxID=1886670 RepID=A0A1E3KZ69_9BACL|nr:S-layer homology domain-containing protein [Paenibacillus nuruki]ODP26842.1 Mannan endo-1,4-beta-mannosidase [Paenibacillus nuruki]